MYLTKNSKIDLVLPDPFIATGKNIDGSDAIFFHGTLKESLNKIESEGFKTDKGRPVFSLDPSYALNYCRKTESYLRRLILKNKKNELLIEINDLKNKGVLEENEDLNDTYEKWIDKAAKYYEESMDLNKHGVLLSFKIPSSLVYEPPEAQLTIQETNNKLYLNGHPSVWRTRQFCYKRPSQNINHYTQLNLNSNLINAISSTKQHIRNGAFDYNKYKEARSLISKTNLKNNTNIITQTVESNIIRELRTILTMKLNSLGYQNYWLAGDKLLVDNRWDADDLKVTMYTDNLLRNKFPKGEWKAYIEEALLVIHGLN